MTFRLLDHTADLQIEATASSAGDALAEAGLALTQVVTGRPPHQVKPDQEVAFRLETPDRGAAAVAFLAELLWMLASKGVLWVGGGVAVTEGTMVVIEAKGNGVRYDPALHGRGIEVKAVTYHDLVFERTAREWRVKVTLDV